MATIDKHFKVSPEKFINKARKEKLNDNRPLYPSKKHLVLYQNFPFPEVGQNYEDFRQDILRYWANNKRFTRKEAAELILQRVEAFFSSARGMAIKKDFESKRLFLKPYQYLDFSLEI